MNFCLDNLSLKELQWINNVISNTSSFNREFLIE